MARSVIFVNDSGTPWVLTRFGGITVPATGTYDATAVISDDELTSAIQKGLSAEFDAEHYLRINGFDLSADESSAFVGPHAANHTDGSDQIAEATPDPGGASGLMSVADKGKLNGVEAGAEVNNISDTDATDLTDGGGTTLHSHAHADTTGKTENDHHARQHALSSALDHTGAITDTQHGSRGGGTLHPAVTADPGGVAGFSSVADKNKLDGIASGATNTPLTSTAPVNVTKAAAAVGTGTEAARNDHKHDVSTAAPGATGVATASGEGSATTLARSDHAHQSNTAPVNVTKTAAAIGTSGEPARADHKHDVTTAAPSSVGTANAEGAATSLARSNHVHDHGSQSTPTHHAVAVAGVSNGFLSAADKTKLDQVNAGARPQIMVSMGDSNGPGVSTGSTSPVVLRYATFRGTAVWTPEIFKVVAQTSNTQVGYMDIYDVTNGNVLATVLFSGATPQIISTGTFANLPVGEALVAFRAYRGVAATTVTGFFALFAMA